MDHTTRSLDAAPRPVVGPEDSSSPSRISRKREESRRRLIEAARDAFAQRGIRDTPIEFICEAAGFTRGAFYSNFASKEDLFLEVWEAETTERQRLISEAVMAAQDLPLPDDVEGLRAVVAEMARRYVTITTGDETWFTLILEFRLQGLRRPDLRPRVEAVLHKGIDEFADLIATFVERSGVRLAVDVAYVARAVLALYHDIIANNLMRDLPMTADNTFLTEVIPRMLSGLLEPSPPVPTS